MSDGSWDGRPERPEVDGWHWLVVKGDPAPKPCRWYAEGEDHGEPYLGMWEGASWSTPNLCAKVGDRYLGPIDPPGTGAALARAEAERDGALARNRGLVRLNKATQGHRDAAYRALADALVVFDIGQDGSTRFHAAYRDVIDSALRAQGDSQ